MKRFSFPWQRAMEWREKKSEAERQELTRLHGVRASLEQQREDLSQAASASAVSLAESREITGADLRLSAAWLTSLRASHAGVVNLQAQCNCEIVAQTERCVSADRDFRLLEKLRDHRFDSWRYDFHREEERAATEVWQAGQQKRRT